jgi:hypothetical protein
MDDCRGYALRPFRRHRGNTQGRANLEPVPAVKRIRKRQLPGRLRVSLLKRLLGRNEPPKARVRICVECGMPLAEQHKDWCSIRRGQIEMKVRSEDASQAS